MLLRTGWWFAFGRTCPSVAFINLNWIAPIDGQGSTAIPMCLNVLCSLFGLKNWINFSDVLLLSVSPCVIIRIREMYGCWEYLIFKKGYVDLDTKG